MWLFCGFPNSQYERHVHAVPKRCASLTHCVRVKSEGRHHGCPGCRKRLFRAWEPSRAGSRRVLRLRLLLRWSCCGVGRRRQALGCRGQAHAECQGYGCCYCGQVLGELNWACHHGHPIADLPQVSRPRHARRRCVQPQSPCGQACAE